MDNTRAVCLMKAMIVYGRGLDDNNKQLYAACKKFVGKPILARIMDLSAYIRSDRSRFWHGDKQLGHIDLCFLRSFGSGSCEQITKRISMMEHLELSGVLMVNSTYAYRKTKDKYSMTYTLARAKLPIPRTYVTETAHWAYRASGDFKQSVYKPIVGSLGFGSMKFENIDLAFNAYTTLERLGQPLYIQEYLEKPGRDIRAFVLGDQILASVYRVAQPGRWKTNVAQRAKTKPMQLSTEIQKLAVKAAKALNLLYAGVDILETGQGAVIAEVNASPSWQGVQQTTGINIAENLVQFIVDYMKH